MIGLRAATDADKLHLAKCFSLDEWHRREHIENWMATDITTFYDERGPVFHMAFNSEGKSVRLHAQFNPLEKYRTAKAIPRVLEILKDVAVSGGYDTLCLWSASPGLISLLERLGFKKSGEDYVLTLEAGNAAIRTERAANC